MQRRRKRRRPDRRVKGDEDLRMLKVGGGRKAEGRNKEGTGRDLGRGGRG